MDLSLRSLAYAGVFVLFLYQLGAGALGMKDRHTSLRPFQLFLFLLFLSSELSRSFFPLFAKALSHGPTDRTFGAALPQVVWGLSALLATPVGWLVAKRIGYRNALLGSALLTAAALALTAASDNYWVMLASRAVVSAGYGLVNIVAVMYLAERGINAKNLAVLLAAIATSSICGNSIGGLLVTSLSYAQMFWLSAATALGAAVVLQVSFSATGNVTARRMVSYAHLLRDWKIQLFAILNTMPYRFVLTGFVLYLVPVMLTEHRVAQATIGQLMMLYFLVNYLLVKPVAALLDRFGSYRTVALASTAITGVGLVLFAHALGSRLAMVCAIVLIAVGMSLNSSIQVPIVPIVFKRECRLYGSDSLLAYFRTVERVGSVAGPLLTAVVYKAWPEVAPAVIGWTIVVTTGLLGLLLVSNETPTGEPAGV
jgi:predicted MFS family arabinose efflux permease